MVDNVPIEIAASPSPFHIPRGCQVSASVARDIFQSELWRFQAKHGIMKKLRANIVIFSQNVFGVIFIGVERTVAQELVIFERVDENLTGTQHCEVFSQRT